MRSAWGIEHGEIDKGLREIWVGHQQKKFNRRYPAGENQEVKTRHAHQMRWRSNLTDPKKVDRMATKIKTEGQKVPITIGRQTGLTSETVVHNGHHRIAAARKAGLKTVRANVRETTYPRSGKGPAPLRPILEQG
jgi:hypothetical protein